MKSAIFRGKEMEQKLEVLKKQICEFDIRELLPIGLTIVVLGIGLTYGLNVMGDVRDDMVVDSLEYNASVKAMEGVAKIPNKLPLIVTVIVAAVIIGILTRYLMVRYT